MFITPKLVGILNITPDSFSGDGLLSFPESQGVEAIQRCFELGADYIDIGAEATSPGSDAMTAEAEQQRLLALFQSVQSLPVVARAKLMCDTRHAETAKKAAKAGFGFINDVSGGRADLEMLPFIASSGLQYVMMYAKNESGRADLLDNQAQVFQKIDDFFDAQLNAALSVGIKLEQIILDPGMGAFVSVHPEDSLEIIARLGELKKRYQRPFFVGVSRKGFLAKLCRGAQAPQQRLGASLALAVELAKQGADYLRIHDIRETGQFFEVQRAFRDYTLKRSL